MEISSTEIVSSNTIFPLPKKYDTPSEKVGGGSGYLDDTKHALVNTTDTVVKEGNNYMVYKEGKSKQNFVEESITPPISEKSIDTVKKYRKHLYPIKQ